MAYDHITKDLCSKARDDCQAAIERTAALSGDIEDRMMIGIWAAGGCLAAASGYVAALVERDTGARPNPAEAVDALWEMIRPVVLSSSGGSRAPFEALLAQTKEAARG
ncbi:hypothetical protein [Sphingomonas parapaucimobilis]|uniref:hypothetical protein n=1 Tax=Sphingomonas parapaucimobilis TaxID=28213 RepID=UPI00321BD728